MRTWPVGIIDIADIPVTGDTEIDEFLGLTNTGV